jgi:tRNA threonylcarbamoyl adenosine modification protein (Sua5/YciO/YrdC/YwlC family)
MPTNRVVLRDISDVSAVAAEAARRLAAGQLVVFPTETVYGLAANADDEQAVSRLYEVKDRPPRKPLTIHLADAAEVERYAAPLTGRARRLAARAWPGPLTLVVDRRPDAPGAAGAGGDTVGLRVPDHDLARTVLRLAGVPVVASSANRSGRAPPASGEEVMANLEHLAAADIEVLVLDDGPARYGRGSTVVRASNEHLSVLREGWISAWGIVQKAAFSIVFLCSGNTCRSPMAEVLARRMLARHANVSTRQLEEAGYRVASAGTGAVDGLPASDAAVTEMARRGYDLASHRSRRLEVDLRPDDPTRVDLARADLVFAMTETQRANAAALWPAGAERVHRLDPDVDIEDPVGGDETTFRACADQIERALEKRLDLILDEAGR